MLIASEVRLLADSMNKIVAVFQQCNRDLNKSCNDEMISELHWIEGIDGAGDIGKGKVKENRSLF